MSLKSGAGCRNWFFHRFMALGRNRDDNMEGGTWRARGKSVDSPGSKAARTIQMEGAGNPDAGLSGLSRSQTL
jgi:hypothetical protein